ncbi:MAG: dynamin family protein [Saprospiraceae bacterium]|nr:dynamin family protein [Saprospiraceae bacterium]
MKILDDNLQALRAHIDEIAKDLHELTIEIGHEQLRQTVSELRNRINEPFMFVIVGEVKAGKSSFINALLSTGKEVCKVAPQPMTDTIQQVIWGETEQVISINPYLKKITHPVEILKEIAIVDTPGTNTIVEHHQEITERFIPSSDLIVFVFEAKNPYRQSAWDFFDYIHSEWRRKVIFVLQQKDLMNEADLPININGVYQHAQKKGIAAPHVFAVSAKLEQEGNQDESGYLPLRNFIRDNITGGKAPILKLTNNISTCRNLNERIGKGIADRRNQWEADVRFRKEVTETLEKQEGKSLRQVDMLVENLLAGYDRITLQKEEELEEGLSFFTLLKRTIAGIFTKKASAQEWLEALAKDLDQQLHLELQNKLNDNVADLADSIQQMAKTIDQKIHHSETILRNNHEIFSDIAERRATVMQDLQETFTKFLNRPENFSADQLFPDKKMGSASIATGGGLAVVGIILAAVTKLSVFDVTGGVLTSIGVLFAGFTSAAKKRKIVEGFRQEIQKGRGLLQGELSNKLRSYVKGIKEKIEANFEGFDSMLERKRRRLVNWKKGRGIEGGCDIRWKTNFSD